MRAFSESERIKTYYISSGSINLIALGCGGYTDERGGQKKVAQGVHAFIQKNNLESENTFFVHLGDLIYPFVSLEHSHDDFDRYMKNYYDLPVKALIVALGNHEQGCCLYNGMQVETNPQNALRRVGHLLDYFSQRIDKIAVSAQYYSIVFKKKSSDKNPFLQLFIIDSTSFCRDTQDAEEQRQWFKKNVEVSTAEKKILISHHAIGHTPGKRYTSKDEREKYAFGEAVEKQSRGNLHKLLYQQFIRLAIHPTLFQACICSHDHFLSYVDNPDYGISIIAGGGALRDRGVPKIVLPGQQFPKSDNLKAGKTGGFAYLQIKPNVQLCTQLFCYTGELLYTATARETLVHDLEKAKTITLEILQEYLPDMSQARFSIFHPLHHHNQRAYSLMVAVRSAQNIVELKHIVHEQYKLFMEIEDLVPYPPREEDRHKALINERKGGFFQVLVKAEAYLEQVIPNSPPLIATLGSN